MQKIQLNDPNRFSKKMLKKYITELMIKYKDKPDSIIVLHEIFLMLNEPSIRVKGDK